MPQTLIPPQSLDRTQTLNPKPYTIVLEVLLVLGLAGAGSFSQGRRRRGLSM